jgi:hypothetical protein
VIETGQGYVPPSVPFQVPSHEPLSAARLACVVTRIAGRIRAIRELRLTIMAFLYL